jgi:CBS domain containing-hemolysin-like protein
MDADSWLLFALLFALILGGGYFAAAETAFASVNAMRIRRLAEEDEEKPALRAHYILEHFNKALSVMLIGNNIMHIGTASIATYLVTRLWGEGYTGYSTIVTTVVVFLISEMIPKQFAKSHPEKTSLFLAGSLYWLMKLLGPLSAVFEAVSDWICRLLKPTAAPTVTEDELLEMIDSLAGTDEPSRQRSRLLHSALEFEDITAGDIMIPLDTVVGVRLGASAEEVLTVIRGHKYSRIPVYRQNPGNLVGVLDMRRYIKEYLNDPTGVSVGKLMQKTLRVDMGKQIDDLFDDLTQSRTHMCFVTNSKGAVVGIATMEDILEELVGEIWDEGDPVAAVKLQEGAL